jgi:hypothetical protein
MFCSQDAVIRVFDESGNVIETREPAPTSKSHEAGLPTCSLFADIPSMVPGIDCTMQSNSS